MGIEAGEWGEGRGERGGLQAYRVRREEKSGQRCGVLERVPRSRPSRSSINEVGRYLGQQPKASPRRLPTGAQSPSRPACWPCSAWTGAIMDVQRRQQPAQPSHKPGLLWGGGLPGGAQRAASPGQGKKNAVDSSPEPFPASEPAVSGRGCTETAGGRPGRVARSLFFFFLSFSFPSIALC